MYLPIVLASSSPRRQDLLKQIGLSFSIEHADVDESVLSGEDPEEHTLRLAREKAKAVALRRGPAIVIGADTVVVVDGRILGKPADLEDAQRMLFLLSGREHRVISGVAVLASDRGALDVRNAVTAVRFRTLGRDEVAAYVATGEPLDKAGAYGIQGRGALLVESIRGCYFNVVGLPLSLLGTMLAPYGVLPGR